MKFQNIDGVANDNIEEHSGDMSSYMDPLASQDKVIMK